MSTERRISEMVWQQVPGCRACNRKRPTTELGATVSWHDELMATCRAEPLTTGNISRRLAAVHKVLRSIALQTPTNSHSELELDTLRNIQSMELALEQMCQSAVELVTTRAAAFSTRWRRSVVNGLDYPVLQPLTRDETKACTEYRKVFVLCLWGSALSANSLWVPGGCTLVEIHLPWNTRWRTPNFQCLNRYNSAADCSISLKFGTEFDHVTAAIHCSRSLSKIKGQRSRLRYDVTYRQ